MAEFEFTFENNSGEVIKAKDEVIEMILEAWGQFAEGEAKNIITNESRVDTGVLRNSISHQVDTEEEVVYIGTNVEYAVFNEIGTGVFTDGGGGRQTPWRYQDRNGQWHITHGMKGIHFLRDAIQDNLATYQSMADQYLKQG